MVTPIPLPDDVVEFVRTAFAEADASASSRLDRMPTVHEETLDFAIIDKLLGLQGPTVLPSQAIVDVDVHFVGGGWHWDRWEVADLGVIMNFRRVGQLLRTKVVLLQSKRIYPREVDFVEEKALVRAGGFGSLMQPSFSATLGPRSFQFDSSCRYRALQVGDDQWQAISGYETQYALPIYYLLYHPSSMPVTRTIPATTLPSPSTDPLIGARVTSAASLRAATTTFVKNQAPSYSDLLGTATYLGLPLGDFMADEVLGCRAGHIADPNGSSAGLNRVFNQRNAPIAAAISIDINLPETLG